MLNFPIQPTHPLDRRTPPSAKPEVPEADQPTSLDHVLAQLSDHRVTMMQHVDAIGIILAKARGNEAYANSAGEAGTGKLGNATPAPAASVGGVFGELQEVLSSIFYLQDIQRAQIVELSRHV